MSRRGQRAGDLLGGGVRGAQWRRRPCAPSCTGPLARRPCLGFTVRRCPSLDVGEQAVQCVLFGCDGSGAWASAGHTHRSGVWQSLGPCPGGAGPLCTGSGNVCHASVRGVLMLSEWSLPGNGAEGGGEASLPSNAVAGPIAIAREMRQLPVAPLSWGKGACWTLRSGGARKQVASGSHARRRR